MHRRVWTWRRFHSPRSNGDGPAAARCSRARFARRGIPDAIDALGRIQHQVEWRSPSSATDGLPSTIIEKKKILDAIERNGLGAKTRLLGYQPYRVVMEEARRHHVFLSPSVTAQDGDSEGGAPVSLIEMSAAGLMLVSTTHCDIPGVVIHGRTGLLAPEHDVEALATTRWLIANPSRWADMRAASRAHIEAEFDAGSKANAWVPLSRDRCARPFAGGAVVTRAANSTWYNWYANDLLAAVDAIARGLSGSMWSTSAAADRRTAPSGFKHYIGLDSPGRPDSGSHPV